MQANRAKAKAPYDFGEGHNLPPTMPQGFNDKLANRLFKRKVLDMICNSVAQHVSPMPAPSLEQVQSGRALIIDYSSCPIQYSCSGHANSFAESVLKPEFMVDLPPLGEADVKFLRWAELFQGDIMAHSVDGDFIPIALIRHELNAQKRASNTPDSASDYKIALHRLKYKMPDAVAAASAAKKSKLGASGDAAVVTKSKKREYEYVNVPELYACMNAAFEEILGKKLDRNSQFPEQCSYMRLLAVLIGLSGTDFTRSLPHISPPTMWKMVQEDGALLSALIRAFDTEKGVLNVPDACNYVAGR